MFNFLRRSADPISDPLFGQLEWTRSRGGGTWNGRLLFIPTRNEIDISIPGGPKGPAPAHALFQEICKRFDTINAVIDNNIQEACDDESVVPSARTLQGLYFFDASIEEGDWKLVYAMGEHELHVDGYGVDASNVFVLTD